MVGDINAFNKKSNSNALLTEMFECFEEEGFDWMTRGFENHNLGGSFVAFPFDIKRFFKQDDFLKLDRIKSDASAFEICNFYLETATKRNATYVSTMLDHVFTKNLHPASVRVYQLLMIVDNINNRPLSKPSGISSVFSEKEVLTPPESKRRRLQKRSNENAASDIFITDPIEMPTRKELEEMVYNSYKQHQIFTPSDHIPYIIKLDLGYHNDRCRINTLE